MSAQIRLERNAYYDILERTQKGRWMSPPWMQWFLGCLDRAFEAPRPRCPRAPESPFWEAQPGAFNDRQRKIVNRLLDGFEGKLTSSKWAKLAKCSQDTASRDINDLVEARTSSPRTQPEDEARAIRSWTAREVASRRPHAARDHERIRVLSTTDAIDADEGCQSRWIEPRIGRNCSMKP